MAVALFHTQRQLTGDAVLHQHAIYRFSQAGFKRGMCRAHAGVAGKRYLFLRRKHAQPVATVRAFGGEHEGGFRQFGPACDGLHRRIVQTLGIQHHGQWIAAAGAGGKDIQLQEAASCHGRRST